MFALLLTSSANSQWFSQSSNTVNNLNCVRFVNDNTGIIVGNSGVVRRTTNAGLTWHIINIGDNSNLNKIFMLDENSGYIVGNSGRIFYTTNQGSNWIPQASGTNGHLTSVYFTNQQTGYVVGNSGILRKTTNGGTNWFNIPSSTVSSLTDVKFLNSDTGFIIGANATVLRTSNGGLNWSVINLPSTAQKLLLSIDFADNDNGVIVKNNDNSSREIFRTTNGGLDWITINLGSVHTLREVQFLDSQNGVIVGDEGDYFRTFTGGAYWIMLPTNTMQWLFSTFFINPEVGWAVGTNGTVLFTETGSGGIPNAPTNLNGFALSETSIFIAWQDNSYNELGFRIERANGGSGSFSEIATVNPNTSYYIDNSGLTYGNYYQYRVAAYNNSGMSGYSNVIEVQLVSIEPISSVIPESFKLHNNYPNPFNPITKIRFDVPTFSPVKIEVFNLKGEVVEELFNSNLNAGQYEITFDSKGLSSGVYFYRMFADRYFGTQRMVLLK